VVTGEALSSTTPLDIIFSNNRQLPSPYPGRDGVYTAAVWYDIEDVPLTFVVGDGKITESPDGSEYYNRRLSECTTYGVFHYIRLQSDTGREVWYFNWIFESDFPMVMNNNDLQALW